MSGILSAICANVLLVRLQSVLAGRYEITRAFADDTAVVGENYVATILSISVLVAEYGKISGLHLRRKKTIFIPLWRVADKVSVHNLIKELWPKWSNITVQGYGKYRGFVIGPESESKSWASPLRKYSSRVEKWQNTNGGLFWNAV